jgi:hypothetical protein
MATVLPFSPKIDALLATPPHSGSTHRWMAQVASGLQRTYQRADAFCILRACCDRFVSHRSIPDREIEAAVSLAYDTPGGCHAKRGPMADWPEKNDGTIDMVISKTEPLFDPAVDTGVTAQAALEMAFGPGELVCAGWRCESAVVATLERWTLRAGTAQFVCVNPMKGLKGVTRTGKQSARCQDNVAVRRWIVAEFDDPNRSKADQARVITALSKGMPLRIVVDSAGKSLHAWFHCEGVEPNKLAQWFWLACALGADRTRWDPCGWLRMPGGIRRKEGGAPAKQKIVYFQKGV